MANPWLSPLRRSYQAIKVKLLEKLKEIKDPNDPSGQLPLITDTSEGNILNIILSLLSGIAEVIHVYIDNLYRESFLSTAQRYDSVVNHLNLIDYHPAAATASEVYLDFNRSINTTLSEYNLLKSGNYTLQDSAGNTWMLAEDMHIPAGVTLGKAKFKQHVPYTPIGSTTQEVKGTVYAVVNGLSSNNKLEQGTLQTLRVGNTQYNYVPTFAYSKSTDYHFTVESDLNNNVVVIFGDGKFGYKPSTNQAVTFGSCFITNGAAGNVPSFAISGKTGEFSYANNQASSGGTDYEDFTALKFRAPLSVKTLGVAITKEDFLNLARLVPGVILASLEYICGQDIKLYILGYGSVTQNNALCSSVKEEISKHVPYGTKITVLPMEIKDIILSLEITGRPSYNSQTITSEVRTALYNTYNNMSPALQRSTNGIRISDLYALLDNLDCIDYLTIKDFYITPWLKPLNTSQPLGISYYRQSKAVGFREYLISIINSTQYILYPKENSTYLENNKVVHKSYSGTFGNNLTVKDGDFEFILNISAPTIVDSLAGLNYGFTVYEGSRDIEVDNYYVPRIDLNSLTLKINEVV